MHAPSVRICDEQNIENDLLKLNHTIFGLRMLPQNLQAEILAETGMIGATNG